MQYRVATKQDEEAAKSSRIQWPFKEMNIGDKIVFPADVGRKAQLSCGAYGRLHGMKFKTCKINHGEVLIERVA